MKNEKKLSYAIYFLLILAIYLLKAEVSCTNEKHTDSITVTIAAKQQEQKIGMMIIVLDEGVKTQDLQAVAQILEKDLSFTGQIEVSTVQKKLTTYKQFLTHCMQKDCSLAVVIKYGHKQGSIVWWLYDTSSSQLVAHNTYDISGKVVRRWAHAIADQLWPKIIGQEGFFSTKISYCKEGILKRNRHKARIKHICVADYDGSHERVLIKTPTVNVAPRWNNDLRYPLLFYSESTNENMRLMVANMKGKRKVASSFDGLNMLPAFSRDGKKVVYCASRGTGNCQIYYYQKGQFKRITHNSGNNVSPSFSGDGNKLYFCSDFQTGYPQIYTYDLITKKQTCITSGGYCAAPAYCHKTDQLIYSKMVNGVMQLMLYDNNTKQHIQLTFDPGNKQEASWSPCGNHVIFNLSKGHSNRIAFFSLHTKKYRFITSQRAACSYPHWSPTYISFPITS
ncbi:PD40 domain-containing protein [Candidatus Dependentiae bacterium]|nr:PD40 domain-containing protein [Candidatus Dependentiae bacterium]